MVMMLFIENVKQLAVMCLWWRQIDNEREYSAVALQL